MVSQVPGLKASGSGYPSQGGHVSQASGPGSPSPNPLDPTGPASVDSPRVHNVDHVQRPQEMPVEHSKEMPDALPLSNVPAARTAQRPDPSGNHLNGLPRLLFFIGAIFGQAAATGDQAVDCNEKFTRDGRVRFSAESNICTFGGLPNAPEVVRRAMETYQGVPDDFWVKGAFGPGSGWTPTVNASVCEEVGNSPELNPWNWNTSQWVQSSGLVTEEKAEECAWCLCHLLINGSGVSAEAEGPYGTSLDGRELGCGFEFNKTSPVIGTSSTDGVHVFDPNNEENTFPDIYLASMLSLLGAAGVFHNGYLSRNSKNRLESHIENFVKNFHGGLSGLHSLVRQVTDFGKDQTHQGRSLACHLVLTVAFGLMRYFDARNEGGHIEGSLDPLTVLMSFIEAPDEDGHIEGPLDPSTKNIAIIGGLPLMAHLLKQCSPFLKKNHNGNLLGKPNIAQLEKTFERLSWKIDDGQATVNDPTILNRRDIKDQITQTLRNLKKDFDDKTFIDNPGRCDKLLSSVYAMGPELLSLVFAWAVSTLKENDSESVLLAALGYIVLNISIQKLGSNCPFYGSVDSQAAIKALKKLEGYLSRALAVPESPAAQNGTPATPLANPADLEAGAANRGKCEQISRVAIAMGSHIVSSRGNCEQISPVVIAMGTQIVSMVGLVLLQNTDNDWGKKQEVVAFYVFLSAAVSVAALRCAFGSVRSPSALQPQENMGGVDAGGQDGTTILGNPTASRSADLEAGAANAQSDPRQQGGLQASDASSGLVRSPAALQPQENMGGVDAGGQDGPSPTIFGNPAGLLSENDPRQQGGLQASDASSGLVRSPAALQPQENMGGVDAGGQDGPSPTIFGNPAGLLSENAANAQSGSTGFPLENDPRQQRGSQAPAASSNDVPFEL